MRIAASDEVREEIFVELVERGGDAGCYEDMRHKGRMVLEVRWRYTARDCERCIANAPT